MFFATGGAGHGEDWMVTKKTYRNIHVIKVNPDTVSVTYDGGTGRLNLNDLDSQLQLKFKDASTRAKEIAVIERNSETDPIAHLVVKLAQSEGGMWRNGTCFIDELPEDTSPEDLAASVLPKWGYSHYDIIDVKRIPIPDTIPSEKATEILFHAGSSDKILLLIREGKSWWSRPYDSELRRVVSP